MGGDLRKGWDRRRPPARSQAYLCLDLASSGSSLPMIGALLGHTQAQTTHRYAHLFDDPLRAATEQVGSLMSRNVSRMLPEQQVKDQD